MIEENKQRVETLQQKIEEYKQHNQDSERQIEECKIMIAKMEEDNEKEKDKQEENRIEGKCYYFLQFSNLSSICLFTSLSNFCEKSLHKC